MATTRAKPSVPINYADQLSKEAENIGKRISAPSGDRIQYEGSRGFKTPDGTTGETLEVIIVDFVSTNLFYDRPFDRGNPQPPACFAIGPEPSTLVPSSNSPNIQADTCTACPNNQFNSAPNGKGKACKNTRLLALIPLDALDNPDADPPMWILSIPPASIKSFDAYVSTLATKHRTIPIGVTTQITLDPSQDFAAPRFSVIRPLNNEELAVPMELRDAARKRLTSEPDVSQYVPMKAAARRGNVR